MPDGHLPVVSYLAIPVIGRTGEVLGGLFFGHPEVGRFTERHERLMVGIAAQAAVGMDNARLYQAAQKELADRMRAEAALRQLNETLETRVEQEVDRRSEPRSLRQSQKMERSGSDGRHCARSQPVAIGTKSRIFRRTYHIFNRGCATGPRDEWCRTGRNATQRLLAFRFANRWRHPTTSTSSSPACRSCFIAP